MLREASWFDPVADFIEEQTGIRIPDSTYPQAEAFVGNHCRDFDMTAEEFMGLAASDSRLMDELIRIITINETYFFREDRQFSCLQACLGELAREREEPLSFWSASCSSGEEALSLYALAASQFAPEGEFRVYASDISDEELDRFQRGVYRPASFRDDGREFHPLLEAVGQRNADGGFVCDPKRLPGLHIGRTNLYSGDFSVYPQMDVVFLRNTLIYMSEATKRRVIDRVCHQIRPGGYLFLSATEVPLTTHPQLVIREHGPVYVLQRLSPDSLNKELLQTRLKTLANGKAGSDGPRESPGEDIQSILARHREARRQPDGKHDSLSSSVGNPDKKARPMVSSKASYMSSYKDGSVKPSPSSRGLSPHPRRFAEILVEINAGKLEEARNMLEALGARAEDGGIPAYLRGYMAHLEKQRGNACRFMEKALELQPELWPARFYLCRNLLSGDPRLGSQLGRTMEDIQTYIAADRYDFYFLLDGFNARYFLEICKTMAASGEAAVQERRRPG